MEIKILIQPMQEEADQWTLIVSRLTPAEFVKTLGQVALTDQSQLAEVDQVYGH
uniref:Uncharacterized protein n=1 Tax=Cyanothece sp. (strain PCC 7425 / ATCC 29141) TaxID=395961 RepID=B8HZN7_CYAP4